MSVQRPPGPDGYPLVGSLVPFLRDRLGFIERCADEYGDIVYRDVLGMESYMLTDPEDIERVLVHDDDMYDKFGFSENQTQRVCGTLVESGVHDFEERLSWFQPVFSTDRLREYAPEMTRAAATRSGAWEPGSVVDIDREMRKLVLEITLPTLFGQDRPLDTDRFLALFRSMLPRFGPRRQPIPDWVPTPTNRRYKRARAELVSYLETLAAEYRSSDESRDDAFAVAVEAVDEGEMVESFFPDEMLTLLAAANETTAFALAITWHLLGCNPEKRSRFHDELNSLLADRDPTFDDLSDLDYTRRVIKESMRLYPPVYSLARIPKQDVEIRGYRIPEGSFVFMPQWVVHRDERFYEDPDSFRPERWEAENARDRPEYAYFPFGGGPRGCIGERFAMTEMQLVLATVGRRRRLDPLDTSEPSLAPGITLQLRDELNAEVVER